MRKNLIERKNELYDYLFYSTVENVPKNCMKTLMLNIIEKKNKKLNKYLNK